MHDVILDELERHLNGQASQAFHAHLNDCAACRATVAEMESISRCLGELKPLEGTAPEPAPGFYIRTAGRIIDHQQKEAWGLFSPGAAFFRRIAFASLLLLAGLGTFLVEREIPEPGDDTVTVMARHDVTTVHTEVADRDRLLVTLATYHQ